MPEADNVELVRQVFEAIEREGWQAALGAAGLPPDS